MKRFVGLGNKRLRLQLFALQTLYVLHMLKEEGEKKERKRGKKDYPSKRFSSSSAPSSFPTKADQWEKPGTPKWIYLNKNLYYSLFSFF